MPSGTSLPELESLLAKAVEKAVHSETQAKADRQDVRDLRQAVETIRRITGVGIGGSVSPIPAEAHSGPLMNVSAIDGLMYVLKRCAPQSLTLDEMAIQMVELGWQTSATNPPSTLRMAIRRAEDPHIVQAGANTYVYLANPQKVVGLPPPAIGHQAV